MAVAKIRNDRKGSEDFLEKRIIPEDHQELRIRIEKIENIIHPFHEKRQKSYNTYYTYTCTLLS
jgi:hypothetical protein